MIILQCTPKAHTIIDKLIRSNFFHAPSGRPRGLMDKASDFESEDCAFESRRGRNFISQSVFAPQLPSHHIRKRAISLGLNKVEWQTKLQKMPDFFLIQ